MKKRYTHPTKNRTLKKAKPLKIGKTYTLKDEAPLMPKLRPFFVMRAIAKIIVLPKGTEFTVLAIDNSRGPAPWYKVSVVDKDDKRIGRGWGWINGVALIKQGVG